MPPLTPCAVNPLISRNRPVTSSAAPISAATTMTVAVGQTSRITPTASVSHRDQHDHLPGLTPRPRRSPARKDPIRAVGAVGQVADVRPGSAAAAGASRLPGIAELS